MKHELWYSVVVRDRQGKVISRERRCSRSFLKAWNQMIYIQMATRQNFSMKDVYGSTRPIDADSLNFAMNAGIGNHAYGILLGTGNTPVAIDDYQLEAKINNGTGAGNMEYLVCTVAESVVAAPSCSFLVSRVIANNSPAIITVREAGIYIKMESAYYCCGIRDVFSVPQAVPIGGAITMDWTLQVTA